MVIINDDSVINRLTNEDEIEELKSTPKKDKKEEAENEKLQSAEAV